MSEITLGADAYMQIKHKANNKRHSVARFKNWLVRISVQDGWDCHKIIIKGTKLLELTGNWMMLRNCQHGTSRSKWIQETTNYSWARNARRTYMLD